LSITSVLLLFKSLIEFSYFAHCQISFSNFGLGQNVIAHFECQSAHYDEKRFIAKVPDVVPRILAVLVLQVGREVAEDLAGIYKTSFSL
jgi:hypothetical protein